MSEGHGAILRIGIVTLAESLKLPEGTTIHAVYQAPGDQFTGTVQIMVEHPDLPTVLEGATPVIADLCYTQDGKPYFEVNP